MLFDGKDFTIMKTRPEIPVTYLGKNVRVEGAHRGVGSAKLLLRSQDDEQFIVSYPNSGLKGLSGSLAKEVDSAISCSPIARAVRQSPLVSSKHPKGFISQRPIST